MKGSVQQACARQLLWVELVKEARDKFRQLIHDDPVRYGEAPIGTDERARRRQVRRQLTEADEDGD